MINLFYWMYGQYWYSKSIMVSHSRTENLYFSSLYEMAEWEQNNLN